MARSTGLPSMLTSPGVTSAFRRPISTRSRCSAAAIRVVRRSRTTHRRAPACGPARSCSPRIATPGRWAAARRTSRHVAPVEETLPGRNPNRRLRRAVAHRRRREPGPGLVEHGDCQVETRDPITLADLGKVGRGHRREDAARAGGQQVGAVGPGSSAPRPLPLRSPSRRCRIPNPDGALADSHDIAKTCWPCWTKYSIMLRPGAISMM